MQILPTGGRQLKKKLVLILITILLLNTFIINTNVKAESPTANAGGPYTGLTYQEINFDGSNSYDINGSIVNYTWNFGDGNIGYGQNPIHSYSSSGIFNITLKVTDNESLNSTDTTTATINVPPTANAGGPYYQNVKQNIFFNGSASYDPDGNIVNYTWDFGDGNISYVENPIHSYNTSGIFNVTLKVTDNESLNSTDTTTATINAPPTANAGGPYSGIIDQIINFDASASTDSDGIIVGYRWDWTNDGTYDTDWLTTPITTHSYSATGSYTIKLEVKDDKGANSSNTASLTVKLNQPPNADAGGPYEEYVNEPITMTGSGSSDPDGTIVGYRWDWTNNGGYDTSWSSSPKATYTYTTAGTYTVKLQVKDNLGATSTDTTSVTVLPEETEEETQLNKKPEANAGGPYYEITGVVIQFDGSDSYDIDGTTLSYKWTFGDGATSTLKMPTHTYSKDGNYTVKLTVTDNQGATDNDTTYAIITKKPNNPPNKPTILGPSSSHINTTCNYTINGSDIDDDKIQYIINWGDQTNQTISPLINNSTAFNTSNSWSTGGIYIISLYAIDENNATSKNQTYTVLIDVHSCGSLGYLIDKNGDTIFDVFYRETTNKETTVEKNNNQYNIDINDDKKWDYTYDLTTNNIIKYSASAQALEINFSLETKWIAIIGFIFILTFFIVLFIFIIKRRKPKRFNIEKKKDKNKIKKEKQEKEPKLKTKKKINSSKSNKIYAFSPKDKKMKKIHKDVDKLLSKKKIK